MFIQAPLRTNWLPKGMVLPCTGDVADFRLISARWDKVWSFHYLLPAESGRRMVFRQEKKGHSLPDCKEGEAVATENWIG